MGRWAVGGWQRAGRKSRRQPVVVVLPAASVQLLTLPPSFFRSPPFFYFCSTGMGDVVSLVEKAEDAIQADEAAELTKKMMTGGRVVAGREGGREGWCGDWQGSEGWVAGSDGWMMAERGEGWLGCLACVACMVWCEVPCAALHPTPRIFLATQPRHPPPSGCDTSPRMMHGLMCLPWNRLPLVLYRS